MTFPSLARSLVGAAGHRLSTLTRGDPPPGLDATPRDVVFTWRKLELSRIRPVGPTTSTPVLLIPPLMVRPYIYDLQPSHSLLASLRDAGLDVYLVDFGVPGRRDAGLRLDDYVLDFVPTLIDRTLSHSGARRLAIVGYCMGGLFGLMHVGTHGNSQVRALVTIGSPVNFREAGMISVGARLTAPVMDAVVDLLGNIPGELSSFVFKLISARRIMRSYVQLLRHPDDDEHVRSFRAINYWINDMLPYPQEAYRQLFHEVILGNKLRRGTLAFGGRPCRLDRVRGPVLAFAGEQDIIAPPSAIREVVELVASDDKRLEIVPGGHVGVVAGSAAPARVWRPMINWLGERLRA